MAAHFMTKCKICFDIIAQCRCPSLEKYVELSVCDKCKKKQEPTVTLDQIKDEYEKDL